MKIKKVVKSTLITLPLYELSIIKYSKNKIKMLNMVFIINLFMMVNYYNINKPLSNKSLEHILLITLSINFSLCLFSFSAMNANSDFSFISLFNAS
jgi:hypothetical protein